jgi:hypothetical protein
VCVVSRRNGEGGSLYDSGPAQPGSLSGIVGNSAFVVLSVLSVLKVLLILWLLVSVWCGVVWVVRSGKYSTYSVKTATR